MNPRTRELGFVHSVFASYTSPWLLFLSKHRVSCRVQNEQEACISFSLALSIARGSLARCRWSRDNAYKSCIYIEFGQAPLYSRSRGLAERLQVFSICRAFQLLLSLSSSFSRPPHARVCLPRFALSAQLSLRYPRLQQSIHTAQAPITATRIERAGSDPAACCFNVNCVYMPAIFHPPSGSS